MSDHMAQPGHDEKGPMALYRVRHEYSWTRGGEGDEEWAEEGRPLSGGPTVYYRYYWDLEKGALRHGVHGPLGTSHREMSGRTRTTTVTVERALIAGFGQVLPNPTSEPMCCEPGDLWGMEYEYGSPYRYDGVSVWSCKHGRFGRFCGERLRTNDAEPPFCEGGPHPMAEENE